MSASCWMSSCLVKGAWMSTGAWPSSSIVTTMLTLLCLELSGDWMTEISYRVMWWKCHCIDAEILSELG